MHIKARYLAFFAVPAASLCGYAAHVATPEGTGSEIASTVSSTVVFVCIVWASHLGGSDSEDMKPTKGVDRVVALGALIFWAVLLVVRLVRKEDDMASLWVFIAALPLVYLAGLIAGRFRPDSEQLEDS
jgi:hypothetical protein